MSQSPDLTFPRSFSWNRSWHSPRAFISVQSSEDASLGREDTQEPPLISPDWILIINTQGSLWTERSDRLYFEKSLMLFYWLHFKSKSVVTFQRRSATRKHSVAERAAQQQQQQLKHPAMIWNHFDGRCTNIVLVFVIWANLVWFGLIRFILNSWCQ